MKLDRAKKYQLAISVVFLVLLLYLLSGLRFGVVFTEITGANKKYLLLGVLSLILAALVKIIRFALVTSYYHYPISYSEASIVQMTGISIAILTPARVGEGSKAVLLNKRSGVPMTTSLGIIVFERLFDMLLLGTGAMLFSLFVLQSTISALIGAFVFLVFILILVFLRNFNTLKRLLPKRYWDYFAEVKMKDNPLSVLAIFAITSIAWLFEAAFPWLIALSMNATVPFHLIFGVVCISTIAVVLSILPAGIGTLDLSFIVLLPLVGVVSETALSILLIYRFFGIVIPFLLALIIINYHGLSIKEFKGELKK